jgi:hypothetical protein
MSLAATRRRSTRKLPISASTPATHSVVDGSHLTGRFSAPVDSFIDLDAEPGLEGESAEPRERVHSTTSAPASALSRLLQRQGVPSGLIDVDVLSLAETEVGGMSFEQWWSARASHIKTVSSSVYYEGLVLSLLLDHMDDPDVWTQVAARRWLTLNLVANTKMRWDQARGLLPLGGVGGMPTNYVYELQRFAKSQQELSISMSSASSFRGRGGRGRGRGLRRAGGTMPSQEVVDASSGRGRRRSSASGAGASREIAASAEAQ